MHDESKYSLESAREAAEHERLGEWVRQFLASPGSDNAPLAQQLSEELGWWVGPVQLRLDQVNRLAGPPGDPVLCPVDEEFWDQRVEAIDKLAETGWEPPPVIVAWRDDRFVLEDGNHRVEGIRQAGRRSTWAVVGFAQKEDRDRMASEWGL